MKAGLTLVIFIFSFNLFAAAAPTPTRKINKKSFTKSEIRRVKADLLTSLIKPMSKKDLLVVKKRALSYGGKAVPALIEIMKGKKYPDQNRWTATFLIGRIMGKKASPFIVKFLRHPNWIMRMASLKTLLALKDYRFSKNFAIALKDKSFIVRKQALENIRKLSLRKVAPQVWGMLYDKDNYYTNKKGKKRTNLIKDAIKTVGDLRFVRARGPLFKMIQKDKYQDIFSEMEYSLNKITGKKAPKGNLKLRRRYWNKVSLSYKTF